MSKNIRATDASLDDLRQKFGLQRVEQPDFFPEWQSELTELSEEDKRALDKIRTGYFNLIEHPPIIEDTIKLAVLSPLLYVANYFLHPFLVKSETPIRLSTEDEDVVMEGKIDVLVLRGNFWLMVIESKRPAYSLEAGLAQMLVYMLASPNLKEGSSGYGMITNGGSFIFIKVSQSEDGPRYATSRSFALLNPGNDLYGVLQILKRLGTLLF